MRTIAQLCLVACALASALYLLMGRFSVGLDFEGGAVFELAADGELAKHEQAMKRYLAGPGHKWSGARRAEVVSAYKSIRIELPGMGRAEAAQLSAQLASGVGLGVDTLATERWLMSAGASANLTVIEPTHDPRLGRPLAAGLSFLSILLWGMAIARARSAPALAGTLLLVLGACMACMLARGSTFNAHVYMSSLILAVPAAVAIGLAARHKGAAPAVRIARAWPAWALLGMIFAGSLVLMLGRLAPPGMIRGLVHGLGSSAALVSAILSALAVLALPE